MAKTQVIDVDLLEEKITDSGLKISYIIDTLGITRQAFDKKRKGITPFRAAEIYVLCDLCRINIPERKKIFCDLG